MFRPYSSLGNDDNAMHVIWHHDKGVQIDMRKMVRDSQPTLFYYLPGIIYAHLTVHHIAEQACSFMRTDGDEISAGLRIIVSPQPSAAAMVFVAICVHDFVGAKNVSPLQITAFAPEAFGGRVQGNTERTVGRIAAHAL